MSWSFSVKVFDRESAYDVIEDEAQRYFSTLSSDGVQEMAEQAADAAAAVAELLIHSVGTDGPWRVNLSGHANPGHGQREGWSNDVVSIIVSEV